MISTIWIAGVIMVANQLFTGKPIAAFCMKDNCWRLSLKLADNKIAPIEVPRPKKRVNQFIMNSACNHLLPKI